MDNLENILESLLFLAGDPLSFDDIADKLSVSVDDILESAEILRKKYSKDCGIHLLKFNKKLQFSSNPIYVDDVAKVLNPVRERELSTTVLETVAIIAYKQPITRLEVDNIRGVKSEYAFQVLLKNNMIEIVGRKDAVGKPVLFGTTDNFLKRFQLKSIEELPDMQTLMEKISALSKSSTELYHRDEYEQNQINIEELSQNDIPEFLQGEENLQIIE